MAEPKKTRIHKKEDASEPINAETLPTQIPAQQPAPETKHDKNYGGIVTVILIIGILIFLATVPIVNQPYQVQEQQYVPLSYNVLSAFLQGEVQSILPPNWITKDYVQLQNTDTQGGTFTVNCDFETQTRHFTDSKSIYLGPGQSGTAICLADTDMGENVQGHYKVLPSSKTITVTKTKYRMVPILAAL